MICRQIKRGEHRSGIIEWRECFGDVSSRRCSLFSAASGELRSQQVQFRRYCGRVGRLTCVRIVIESNRSRQRSRRKTGMQAAEEIKTFAFAHLKVNRLLWVATPRARSLAHCDNETRHVRLRLGPEIEPERARTHEPFASRSFSRPLCLRSAKLDGAAFVAVPNA